MKIIRHILLYFGILLALCMFSGIRSEAASKTTIKVTYYANGGKGTMKAQTLSMKKTTALSENVYTKKGYYFIGWNTKKDGTGESYIECQKIKNPQKDMKLYAQWRANRYYIVFDANGGSGKMSKQKMVYGTLTASKKNCYTREGYEFTGWNTKANGKGKSYADGTSFSKITSTKDGTVTLYAQWKVITYTISYANLKGGTNNPENPTTYSVLDAGKTLNILPPESGSINWCFLGWTTMKSVAYHHDPLEALSEKIVPTVPFKKISKSTPKYRNITLYAVWGYASYEIDFDGNGADGGEMEWDEDFINSNLYKIPQCQYTKTGYSFTGWNTKADGTGTMYQEGERVPNLSEEHGDCITLYAQWEIVE